MPKNYYPFYMHNTHNLHIQLTYTIDLYYMCILMNNKMGQYFLDKQYKRIKTDKLAPTLMPR